ncbi:hypothetical protein MRX96_036751 [Rhipicephalus microplus]
MESLEFALFLVTAVPFTSARMRVTVRLDIAALRRGGRTGEGASPRAQADPAGGGSVHGKTACDVVHSRWRQSCSRTSVAARKKKSRGTSFALAAASLRSRWGPTSCVCAGRDGSFVGCGAICPTQQQAARGQCVASQGVAVCLL